MTASRSVEIVGGGLTGLALGAALQRAGIPVLLHEAGRYPRHRVCGEFIAGLDAATISLLDLAPVLADARPAHDLAWFAHGRKPRREQLPEPALALSRYALDARLAAAFIACGGQLRTGSRIDVGDAPAGRVFCTGRTRSNSPWLGLKCHLRDFPLGAGLELHLGRGAYVGLCAVEDGNVNVCGLFRKRPEVNGSRDVVLPACLRAAGLDKLADRIERGGRVAGSWSAVAGIHFSTAAARSRRIHLGDAYAVIAPFTGNGMAIAFQSAAEALPPLVAWSRGEADWDTTTRNVQARLHRRFRRRLRTAAWVHPFLFTPSGQRCLRLAQRAGLAPLRPWYRLLH